MSKSAMDILKDEVRDMLRDQMGGEMRETDVDYYIFDVMDDNDRQYRLEKIREEYGVN